MLSVTNSRHINSTIVFWLNVGLRTVVRLILTGKQNGIAILFKSRFALLGDSISLRRFDLAPHDSSEIGI